MDAANPFWLIGASLLLGVTPFLVGLGTCFTKIHIVLGLLRSGLGTQQVPSNIVVTAIALALTLFVMQPVFEETAAAFDETQTQDFLAHPTLSSVKNLAPLLEPWKAFLRQHVGEAEIRNMVLLAQLQAKKKEEFAEHEQQEQGLSKAPESLGADESPKPSFGPEEVGPEEQLSEEQPEELSAELDPDPSLRILLPAFVLTELREAFAMGFTLLLPFLVIDIIVANILVGLGMFMVSPVMISLPLKVALFVAVDGWLLLSKGLVFSYGG